MNIKSIILAAGQGTRLLPHTAKTPKCLVPVRGFTILHHQLSALAKNGIRDVTIATGFRADEVESYAQINFPGLHLTFARNPEFIGTNTFYSLAISAKNIGTGIPVLQLNGDVIFDPEIIKNMLAGAKTSRIAVQKKECGDEEIKCEIGPDGHITALNKKIAPIRAIGEAVGINLFMPAEWAEFSGFLQKNKGEHSREYFEFGMEHIIRNGTKFHPHYIGTNTALEIDFPEDLAKAQNLPFLT